MSDPKGQLIASRPMTDVKRANPYPVRSQAEHFVKGRSAWWQYMIDCFALAFVLSIGFILLERYVLK